MKSISFTLEVNYINEYVFGYNYMYILYALDGDIGKWSVPTIEGHRPYPCSHFTLTSVGDQQAILFGGCLPNGGTANELYIIEFHQNAKYMVPQVQYFCNTYYFRL